MATDHVVQRYFSILTYAYGCTIPAPHQLCLLQKLTLPLAMACPIIAYQREHANMCVLVLLQCVGLCVLSVCKDLFAHMYILLSICIHTCQEISGPEGRI